MTYESAPRETPPDWDDQEPGMRDVVREVGRAMARARSLVGRILLVTLVLAAGITANRARKPRTYVGRVTLLVTESTLDERSRMRVPRHLRSFVMLTMLSRRRLAEVVEENKLWTTLGTDMATRITKLREGIEVDVEGNYFLWEREPGGPPRTARVVIEFSAPVESVAAAVSRDLGRVVMDEMTFQRGEMLAEAARDSEAAAKELREILDAKHTALARAQVLALTDASYQLRVTALAGEIDQLNGRLEQVDHLRTEVGMLSLAENTGAGLYVRPVLEQVRGRGGSTPGSLATTFGILSALLLPLVALFLGVFDRRLHAAWDMTRMRLPLVIEVPRARKRA